MAARPLAAVHLAEEPAPYRLCRGMPPPRAPPGAEPRSDGGDHLRVGARAAIFSPDRALLQDPIYGVLAVVVDQRAVLVPVSPARAARNLLGPDHHVIDAVPAHQVRSRRVAVEDSLLVLPFLYVVGQPIGPQPARVTDQDSPARERRDGTVVLVRHDKQGRWARVRAPPVRDLQPTCVGELHRADAEVGRG